MGGEGQGEESERFPAILCSKMMFPGNRIAVDDEGARLWLLRV